MLRTDVAADLRDRLGDGEAMYPDYGGYCFAHLPHSLTAVLGEDTGRTLPRDVFADVDTDVSTVLVVLIDSFGFEHWRRDHADHAFLREVTDRGVVTPVTSIYPSETAAAVPTFHTGVLPAEHGGIGWNVYDPDDDQAFEAFSGRVESGGGPDRDPDESFAADPLYPALTDAGVDCRHVVPFPETARGATAHSYDVDDRSTLGPALVDALDAASDPAYVYAYLPQVDHTAHEHGVDAPAYHETLGDVCTALERTLFGLDEALAEDTLLVVTADHGHTNVAGSVDLDGIPGLVDALRRHADGDPVRTAGSPRNVHLHLRDDVSRSAVETTVASHLDARVLTGEEVLETGLFGDVTPSPTFERRLGDLVVIPERDLAWYGSVEPDELDLVGMHGGLSADEMLTQVAAVELGALGGR